MEVVARPTLMPRDQMLNCALVLKTNLQSRSRGHHAESSSKYLRFGSKTGTKAQERYVGLLLWFACWLFTGDLCGCVAVLAVGRVLFTAVLM